MGRLFVIELEGPVYTCKTCHTHLGLPSDIISKEIEGIADITYDFSRLFNTFLAVSTVIICLQDIFCVGCTKLIGVYNESGENGPNHTYWVYRKELHGPEGSDDGV